MLDFGGGQFKHRQCRMYDVTNGYGQSRSILLTKKFGKKQRLSILSNEDILAPISPQLIKRNNYDYGMSLSMWTRWCRFWRRRF